MKVVGLTSDEYPLISVFWPASSTPVLLLLFLLCSALAVLVASFAIASHCAITPSPWSSPCPRLRFRPTVTICIVRVP
ncbi:hypothetical protein DENSPDRAFT_833205, partial [Dentipellis sp. KUC8613]